MAYRLALQMGIVDVATWLKTIPYGVLDQWIAFDSVEPIGEAWRRSAEVVAAIERLIGVEMAKLGVKTEPVTYEDRMPARYRRTAKPKIKRQPVETGFATLKTICGFGD